LGSAPDLTHKEFQSFEPLYSIYSRHFLADRRRLRKRRQGQWDNSASSEFEFGSFSGNVALTNSRTRALAFAYSGAFSVGPFRGSDRK